MIEWLVFAADNSAVAELAGPVRATFEAGKGIHSEPGQRVTKRMFDSQ